MNYFELWTEIRESAGLGLASPRICPAEKLLSVRRKTELLKAMGGKRGLHNNN